MCNSCSIALEEGKIFCPECGDHVIETAHKNRIVELKKNSRTILSQHYGGTFGLLSAIAISLILLVGVLGSFAPLGFIKAIPNLLAQFDIEVPEILGTVLTIAVTPSIIGSLLFSIPAIFSTIGAWMVYAKKGEHTAKQMKFVRAYSTLNRVLAIIMIVLGSIGAFVTIILEAFAFIGLIGATGLGGENGIAAAIITFVGTLFGLSIMIFVLSQYSALWGTIRNYQSRLVLLSAKGAYSPEKPPCIRLWIFGVLLFADLPVAFYLILNAISYRKLHEKLYANLEEIRNEEKMLEDAKQEAEEERRRLDAQRRKNEEMLLSRFKKEDR